MYRDLLRFLAVATLLARPARGQNLNDFFDDTILHEIRVQIAPADWQALHDKYLENTYYRCEFAWRDLRLTDVGVRSRGSGTRNPIKPNLGFDFSRYKSSQRFLSLKSLVTRNFAQDASLVREFLSMKVFGLMGMPYLRESYAKIFVNGEYAGIYLLVEPIDKRFLLTRFGEDSGYLYEGSFVEPPYRFEYLGEDPQLYIPSIFEPKTHEDDPGAARLIEMIRVANQTPASDAAARLSEYLDTDQFVAHLAVEQFLAENDGLVGYGGMTNFYLYRRMSDNRFVILPWDKDNTFSLTDRSLWQNTNSNVLFRQLLSDPQLRQRYLQTVMHAIEATGGAFGWLYGENERVYALIRDAALADPFRVCVLEDGIGRCPAEQLEIQHGYLEGFMAARTPFSTNEVAQAGLVTDPSAPALCAGAVTNLASRATVMVPGALARLVMQSSLNGTLWAAGMPLPYDLQGLRVSVGGLAAPVWMVGPAEVYFQVPWETRYGAQTVHVSWQGLRDHMIDVEVRPSDVGVFGVTHANWTPVTASAPARSGEWIVVWGTGFAWSRERQETGMPSPPDAMVPTGQTIAVTMDGREVNVRFAGMAPGLIGTTQLVLELPAGLPAGRLPLLISVNSETGKPYWIEVRP